MEIEREISGVRYIAKKPPAEQGLALFTRVSTVLSPAEGLFAAISLGSDQKELIHQFFNFAKTMDQDQVNSLILDLAYSCRRVEDGGRPEPADMRELLELAFFVLATFYGDFFPVLPEELFPPGEDVAEAA